MKRLEYFDKWIPLNEATLNIDKKNTSYKLSRPGRRKANILGISEDINFIPTIEQPKGNILHIRPLTVTKTNTVDFLLKEGIPDFTNYIVWKTDDPNYKFAVAKLGITSGMIKQLNRKGSAARGDYFRETAFIITLGMKIYEMYNTQPILRSNRGVIGIEWSEGGTSKLNVREDFEKQYNEFMDSVNGIALMKQVDALIEKLGDNCKRIQLIQKNSKDIAINKFIDYAVKKERIEYKAGASTYEHLPETITLAKWNPSDLWLSFDNSLDWTVLDSEDNKIHDFKKIGVYGLPELNEWLSDCIKNKKGVVGVSLKQQVINPGSIYVVNLNRNSKFTHFFNRSVTKTTTKTVKLNFSFTYTDLGKLLGDGDIDLRTFATDTRSGISAEVKGSKKTQHVSGKAGSYIKYIMADDYRYINFIRSTNDHNVIKDYIDINYDFINPELEEMFYNDVAEVKNPTTHSRMQGLIFADWIEKKDHKLRNEIISDIIRFAKSESPWSAPHLLVR